MKTARRKSLDSVVIFNAAESFKETYLQNVTKSTVDSNSSLRKNNVDEKKTYAISYVMCSISEVPDFFEEDGYPKDVKSFFEDSLNKKMSHVEVSWSFKTYSNPSKEDESDEKELVLDIFLRF